MTALSSKRWTASNIPTALDLPMAWTRRDEALVHVQRLNRILSEKPYLGGKTVSLTDIAIFPFIRQFAATDRIWFDSQSLDGIKNGWVSW